MILYKFLNKITQSWVKLVMDNSKIKVIRGFPGIKENMREMSTNSVTLMVKDVTSTSMDQSFKASSKTGSRLMENFGTLRARLMKVISRSVSLMVRVSGRKKTVLLKVSLSMEILFPVRSLMQTGQFTRVK